MLPWTVIALAGCPYISDAKHAERIAAFRMSGRFELDEADAVLGGVAGTRAVGSTLAAGELGPEDTDADFDATPDLIVGAVGDLTNAKSVAGAVIVIERISPGGHRLEPAGPGGVSGPIGWAIGETDDDGAGWAVAALDGAVLIGAPYFGGDLPDELGPGTAYQLPWTALVSDPDATVGLAEAPGRVRGAAKTGAGFAVGAFDVDGDGEEDAVAGAPFSAILGGRVVAWSDGLGDRLEAVPDYNLAGPVGFGAGLASGDVDGDGVLDLVVGGAYSQDATGEPNGAVYVFTGPIADGASSADAAVEISGGGAVRLGLSLDVGDVDGDGLDDLAVGARETADDAGGAEAGRVWWLPGAGLRSGTPDERAGGSVTGAEAGAVCGAVSVGDVDLDGAAELLVGAPGDDGFTGMVGLFYGPAEGATTLDQAPFVVTGQNRESATGYAVLLADVADDGHLDVVIGAPYESLDPGDDYAGAVGVFFGVGR